MLDVLTPRGKATVAQEDRAIALLEREHPTIFFARTDKRSAAELDGLLLLGGQLYATAEVKCRDMTYVDLVRKHRGEWLLTWDKVAAGMHAHRLLNVGMVGLLYLVPEDLLLVVRILDNNGLLAAKLRVEATETQRTVNGGSAVRNNAYIDISKAKMVNGGQ